MKRIFLMLCACVLVLSVSAKKPMTIFLVGDETMAELTSVEDRTDSAAVGWGQELGALLPEGTIIENHALEGATTRSISNDGRWSNILYRAPKGALLFIQFGHHEYDETDGRSYSSLEDFENHLMTMVADAQKERLKVVLLTPTAKCHFKEAELHPRHGAYVEGVRRVAERNKLPLLDIDAVTYAWIQELGEEQAVKYFAGDDVKLNEAGAKAVAGMVVKEAKEKKIKGFKD